MTAEASLTTKPSLTLKRHFNASPEKIYAAWTDPEEILKWFGPGDGPVTLAETDLRSGGRYAIAFKEDGAEHHVSGVYREVAPNERLVFTWTWQAMPDLTSLVTVLVKPDGDGALLTLIHEQFADEPLRDLHRTGWTGCLESLERYLA